MANKPTKHRAIGQLPAPLVFPVYSWRELFNYFPLESISGPHVFDFIRHGESVGNAKGLVTGSWDAELTVRGMEQARYLSYAIRRHYDLAYCSVLSRSKHTLRLASEGRSTTILYYSDQRINERSLGSLEGTRRANLDQYACGDLTFAPPGGESYLQLTRRVLSFLVDLFQVTNRQMSPLHILISTHAGPLRVLSGALEGLSEPIDVLAREFGNAAVYTKTVREIYWPRFLPSPDHLHE